MGLDPTICLIMGVGVLFLMVFLFLGAMIFASRMKPDALPDRTPSRTIDRNNEQIRKLTPILEERHGKQNHYTPEQVRQANQGVGLSDALMWYAFLSYCSPSDAALAHSTMPLPGNRFENSGGPPATNETPDQPAPDSETGGDIGDSGGGDGGGCGGGCGGGD